MLKSLIPWDSMQKLDNLAPSSIKVPSGSNINIDYTFEDSNPSEGISYYRIRQVDFDGKWSYTPIKEINRNLSLEANIYPNPASKKIIVQFNGFHNAGTIQVCDVFGKVVLETNLTGSAEQASLDIAALKNGYYFVTIETSGFQARQAFVKVNE